MRVVSFQNRLFFIKYFNVFRFGFYQQCINNYGNESVWEDFMNACDCLPICAIVNDVIFAVHEKN